MDEMTRAIPVDETAPAMGEPLSEGTETEEDDWSDLDFSDLEMTDAGEEGESEGHGAEPEADQQEGEAEAEEEEEPAEPEREPEGQEEADQPSVVLKHLGQEVRVTPEQRDALAQMGLDYARIREDRDNARAENARLQKLEDFLKELAAPQNMSIEDLMDTTRAQVLADREGIDRNIALQRVKLEREKQEFTLQQRSAQQQRQLQDQEEKRRQDNFLRFSQTYPDVNPNEIPQEVWKKFGEGDDLVSVYAQYEAKLLREENAVLKKRAETAEQNAKNKVRSTGSQKSAGSTSEMDAFDRAWYDGT